MIVSEAKNPVHNAVNEKIASRFILGKITKAGIFSGNWSKDLGLVSRLSNTMGVEEQKHSTQRLCLDCKGILGLRLNVILKAALKPWAVRGLSAGDCSISFWG